MTKVGVVIDQETRIPAALQAPSRDGSIVVTQGAGGECLHLHVKDEAMSAARTGPQLAERIMLLNTWGRLHSRNAPTEQIAQLERLLDF